VFTERFPETAITVRQQRHGDRFHVAIDRPAMPPIEDFDRLHQHALEHEDVSIMVVVDGVGYALGTA
jgi:hypothetical protein